MQDDQLRTDTRLAIVWFFSGWAVVAGLIIASEPEGRLSSPGWQLARTMMPGTAWGLALAACGAVMLAGLRTRRDMLTVWGARLATIWFGSIGTYTLVVLPRDDTANVVSPMLWLGWAAVFFAIQVVHDENRNYPWTRRIGKRLWPRK